MRNNKGWWCLFVNENYDIDNIFTFGCSKKEFYKHFSDTFKPKLILTVNRLKINKTGANLLNEMLNLRGEQKDEFVR